MHCVYKIVFPNRVESGLLPHSYIGSKTNCKFVDGLLYDKRGKVYYGSSTDKTMLDLIKSGEPVLVSVMGWYDDASDALTAEREMHIAHDVVANPEYFNLGIATVNNFSLPDYCSVRHVVTGKVVKLHKTHPKILDGTYVHINTGKRTYTNGVDEIIAFDSPGDDWVLGRSTPAPVGEHNPFYGKTHTEDSKQLIREANIKYLEEHPEVRIAHAERAKKTFSGRLKTEEHKRKIGEKSKNQIVLRNVETLECIRISKDDRHQYPEDLWVTTYKFSRMNLSDEAEMVICPHCSKESDAGNASFKKHHFDNCKANPDRKNDLIECPKCGKMGERNSCGFRANHFDFCKPYRWEPWTSRANLSRPHVLDDYLKFGELYDILKNNPELVNLSAKSRTLALKNMISMASASTFRVMVSKIIDENFNPYADESWCIFKENHENHK